MDIKYRVPFNNRPLKTPRKIRIVCIGAGFAGLTLAYKVSHGLKLESVVDFCIYERQVGGYSQSMRPEERALTSLGILWGYVGGEQISRSDLRCANPYLYTAVGTEA